MAGGIDNPSAANPYTNAQAIAAVRGDGATLSYLFNGGAFGKLLLPTMSGWTQTITGTGSTGSTPTSLIVNSGAGVSGADTAQLSTGIVGLRDGGAGYCDWSKNIVLIVPIQRINVLAQDNLAWVQLKEAQTLGAMAEKGIGIDIRRIYTDGLDLYGESYGASRASIDLGISLTNYMFADVMIKHYPAVPKIEWYVDIGDGNGFVLKGTETTSANIPQTAGTAPVYLCNCVTKTVANAAPVMQTIGLPIIWQAR